MIARRKLGTCQDCGWTKKVRTVIFWLNDMRYTVCAGCEKSYRHSICWPVIK